MLKNAMYFASSLMDWVLWLLHRDHTAHVGHFGSVRVAKVSQRTLVTTLGFVDPEYGVTGKLTEKSDVFSYGMLLLVLVSGRRMLESHPSGNKLFQPIPQAESALSDLNKAKIRTHVLPEIGHFSRIMVPKCVVLHSTSLIPPIAFLTGVVGVLPR